VSVQGTSVGLDVYAVSVVAHAVDEVTGEVSRARLCPDHGEIMCWLSQLRAPVRVVYEAGPTGFGLARALSDARVECLVAAPSKLQRPAGDRIKTDARDAAHLARLLRLGEITGVRVPDADIEAVRDLVRAREDARADLMRVRHRLSKLPLRQGIVAMRDDLLVKLRAVDIGHLDACMPPSRSEPTGRAANSPATSTDVSGSSPAATKPTTCARPNASAPISRSCAGACSRGTTSAEARPS
jgi:transposase